MPSEIINADRAMDIAKAALNKAGYSVYFISKVKKDS